MKTLFISIFLLIFMVSQNIFCQRHTAQMVIPDSLLVLKKGIYMNMLEFLHNQPCITYKFEVINNNPDYFIHPEERNKFFLTYYDIIGTKVTLNLEDVWGYYDGFGIFINYKGRPYELVYLGSISILRYENYYRKNLAAQAFSLAMLGSTTTSIHSIQDLYYDLRNNIIVPRNDKEFEKLILYDPKFYNAYKSDRKTKKRLKPYIYFIKYNEEHPLRFSDNGISLFY